ncbi:hypothetical protein E5676_scaffold767G00710 [Cucumis melo var. makuwa]|uniref:Uncharacterized protein n=1 Tax=Cucumis melo var. makuwa TaxID=1194695 RepID=A0A5A7UYR0_CUCMM|nr:hypothetical protein E6C27_scaffold386G00060 [Cucumis melo var. makuwa]TYJ95566.1 hypothetical protein E5676_scaffold767G00710 [Cucumis melo var. makuwa]
MALEVRGAPNVVNDSSRMTSEVREALDIFVLRWEFPVRPMKRREKKISNIVVVSLPSCLSCHLPPYGSLCSFKLVLVKILRDCIFRGYYPSSFYEAKRKFRDLSLGYETIHTCKYNCVLYWKEFIDLQHCSTCDEAQYKKGFADMR